MAFRNWFWKIYSVACL